MNPFTMTTPVALLVFNRPETTKRVLEVIRKVRPSQLLLVADGPRTGHPTDVDKCAEVVSILDQIDWPCEVLRNYSQTNLGCKVRVSSGLDWVFSQVEEAIILEDDCLPDVSFFPFCQEMLATYRHDKRVMTVCGTNLLGRWKDDRQSYHFANYDWVWGWASWRRAWQKYDVTMSQWENPSCRIRVRRILQDDEFYALREMAFQQAFDNRIDTWDYQWSFARLLHEGLAAVPSINLVTNIGYGREATHTRVMDDELAGMETGRLVLPLRHPRSIVPDSEYDLSVVRMIARKNTLYCRIVRFFGLVRLILFRR
jgi:hypothetical protein